MSPEEVNNAAGQELYETRAKYTMGNVPFTNSANSSGITPQVGPTWYDQDFKLQETAADLPPIMVAITACLTCGLDEVNCDCDVCRCEFCVREDCTCLMETTTADAVEVDEDPLDVLIRKAGVPDLGDLYVAAGQAGLITLTVDYE